MPTVKGPFREKMFHLVTRNRLADRLVKEQGYSRAEAREAVRELTNEVVEEAANKVAPHAAVGAGGFLQFLLEFLASDAFAALLDILLSLFGGPPQAALARFAPPPASGG